MATLRVESGTSNPLESFFEPRSIALIGATDRSIWSTSAFNNLTRFGFSGKIHLVNPKGGVIHGREAVVSCSSVGEPIDAALIMVPESALLRTFDDMRAANICGAVVLSAGFAELGHEGLERQQKMAVAAREAGIRLIGPNCLGFANYVAKTPIWTTPLRRPMPNPLIAVVSQSGAIAGQLEQFAYQQRIALTHMISTGNEADLTIAEIVDYLATDSAPKAIAVFLETVREPARFVQAVAKAHANGKSLVVLKVGTSEATAKAAQAHTGSLVGDDRVFNALCHKLGIARAASLEELVLTADLMSKMPRPAKPGVALVAMSGGLCEVATDRAAEVGLHFPALQPDTLQALRTTLPPLATPSNPLDITGAAVLEPALITKSLAAIARDPNIGTVCCVFDVPLKLNGAATKFIQNIGAGFNSVEQSCLMLSHLFSGVSGEGRALVNEVGIAYTGSGVDLGLRALRHVVARPEPVTRVPAVCEIKSPVVRPRAEREVLAHLAQHNVPVVPAVVAASAEEAVAAARQWPEGVALKIASPDIEHKTDIGGVALGLTGDTAVKEGFENIMSRVRAARPDAKLQGVVVSPMRRGGVEIFVGTLRDAQWGPCIVIGLGGVWVEALRDTALRLLPVTYQDVLAMLSELRGGALLDGFRGAPAVNRDALARAVVAVGEAALSFGTDLVALEVNPLLAGPERVEALDGLAIWNERTP